MQINGAWRLLSANTSAVMKCTLQLAHGPLSGAAPRMIDRKWILSNTGNTLNLPWYHEIPLCLIAVEIIRSQDLVQAHFFLPIDKAVPHPRQITEP